MTKSKITLTDIAKQADVSIATVSRVMRTPHITSWATQKRVHHAMTLLNWHGNNKLKPHCGQIQSKTILVIDNQLIPHSLINIGLEEKLNQYGYKIVYLRFVYCDEKDIYQLINFTLNHAVDGIIIINHAPYLKNLTTYTYALPPIVLVNQFSLKLPCVYFDHLTTAYQITRYYLNKNHKRIAILLNNDISQSATHLLQGYQQALQRGNIQIEPDYIMPNCFSYQHGQLAIKTLMTHQKPPTAIIITDSLCLNYTDMTYRTSHTPCLYHSALLGALHQCNQMGITIPHQLGLFYFSHNTEKHHNQLDTLNTASKPLKKMGEDAADLLLKLFGKTTQRIQIATPIETALIYRDI